MNNESQHTVYADGTMPPDTSEGRIKLAMDSLNGMFSSAMVWNVTNTVVTQVISLGLFIFLTHQLSPVTFGIYALALVTVNLFAMQGRVAANDAVLSLCDDRERAHSTAFWTTMGLFIPISLLLAGASYWLARWLEEPALTSVMPVLALSLIFVPFSIAPSVLLARRQDFKGFSLRTIVATLVGGAAAVAVALGPYPEWALVTQFVVNLIATNLFLIVRARWIPRLMFDTRYALSFLKGSGQIFFSQSVAASSMRALDVIVGVFFGTAAVGFMRVASRLMEAVQGAFALPVGTNAVLLITSGKVEGEGRREVYLHLSQMLSLICLPLFSGIALTSNEIALALLGDGYGGVGPVLSILCIAGLFSPVTYLRNATLTALGRLKSLSAFAIIDFAAVVSFALLFVRFGLQATVAAVIVAQTFKAWLTARTLMDEMHTPLWSFLKSIAPGYIACAVMALGVIALSPLVTDASPWLRLAVKALVGAGLYASVLVIFFRGWLMNGIHLLIPTLRGKAPEAIDGTA